MTYNYLVFPNYSQHDFDTTCMMVQALLPGLSLTAHIDTVDGPITHYTIGGKHITVYGKITDNEVTVSSEIPIECLQQRVVTI